MLVSDFDFELPPELIAQDPPAERSGARLLYLPRLAGPAVHSHVTMLPSFLQRVSPFLPPYHLGRLALGAVGVGGGSRFEHWEALMGFALICLGIARIGFQRDEGKSYG